jgi:hypothetical protein
MIKHDLNSYQMYMTNSCQLGFFVRRNSCHPSKKAKVVDIQWVTSGQAIKGNPPYLVGFKNPQGHPGARKIMGPRMVTLEANWFDEGRLVKDAGRNLNREWIK